MTLTMLDRLVLRMLTTRLSSGDEGAGLFLSRWCSDSDVHEPSWLAREMGWMVDEV